MAALIGASDWPDVRAALDAKLTSALLPDRVIASPIYAGEAHRRVLRALPGAASLTDPDQIAAARSAAIYTLAALLAPIVPIIVREQDRDYSYQRQAPDFTTLTIELQQRADDMLAELAGTAAQDEAAVTASWLFGRASADRGV